MKQCGVRGIVLFVFLFISAIASPVYAKGACGSAKGSPVWSVNKINLNLYVTDIPLWYTPQIGPRVEIRPSYNSQAAEGQSSPFGSKWQFNYGSFITEDAGTGQVTVAMPDGREDVFTPDGQGGYTKLPGVFNTLTKIGANQFKLRFPDDALYVYIIPANTTLFSRYSFFYLQKDFFVDIASAPCYFHSAVQFQRLFRRGNSGSMAKYFPKMCMKSQAT